MFRNRRRLARIAVLGLACYGTVPLIGVASEARASWPHTVARTRTPPLSAAQQPIVSALARLLDEDGVQQAARWASAIVRSSPTTDLGYFALITARSDANPTSWHQTWSGSTNASCQN